jgi:hypothetical protein
MGYHTDFSGTFNLNVPLSKPHQDYLVAFNATRRMKRNPLLTAKMEDQARRAAKLLLGPEGAYYVGGDEDVAFDVVDINKPPLGQPGLWCGWVPTQDGTGVEWDGAEKFYDYTQWLKYLIANFYQPWGYVLNGRVTWQGEENSDKGTIVVENNEVRTLEGHHPDATTTTAADDDKLDKFLQNACTTLNDLWVKDGGAEMKLGELSVLKQVLTDFFGDKV